MAHILVCDDHADLRMLMRIAFERAGHTVTEAAGGGAIADLLDRHDDLDLLLLDVQMPEVDGWAVLEFVRVHPTHAHLPVLMCTVKMSDADLDRAWSLGCDGYVRKPFDLDDLNRAAEHVMSTTYSERVRYRAEELKLLDDVRVHTV